MTFSTFSKRLAATGAASALAAGALVGATTTSANAVVASSDYVCAVPTLGNHTIPVAMNVPALDPVGQINAGQFVPEGLMNLGGTHAVDFTFTIPATLAPTLSGLGVTDLDSPDFDMDFGSSKVPVTQFAFGTVSPGDAGTLLVTATGTNGAFNAPAAGTHDITMPKQFTMIPTVGTLGAVEIDCETDSPTVLKSMPVVKNESTTTAKPTKRAFEKGTAAKIRAKVTDTVDFMDPSGKVVAKKGTKKYTGTLNDKGVAVINVGRKLKPGKHRFTVSFGSGYYETSTDRVVVKVVR